MTRPEKAAEPRPDDEQLPAFLRSEESSFPLGKIIVTGTVLMALVIGGMLWISGGKSEKEANLLAAKARDEFQAENLHESFRLINRAIALKEKPEYLIVKADILNNQNRAHELELVLKRIVELQPEGTPYRFLLATLLFNSGKSDEALKEAETVCQQQPKNTDYQMFRARMLAENKRLEEAAALYAKTRDNDPNNHETWDQLAIFYANRNQPEKALAIRREAIARFPADNLHQFFLGRELDNMGKATESVAYYRRSLELQPTEDSIAAKRIYEITGKRVPPALERLNTDRVRYLSEANLMFVTADVNGEKGKFLLDTGASLSMIFKSAVKRYNLKPTSVVVSVQTANGLVNLPVVYGSVRIGKYTINNVQFAVGADPERGDQDGILGMDIWNNFQMEFDNAGGYVVLKR